MGWAGSTKRPIHQVYWDSNGVVSYMFQTSNGASSPSYTTGRYDTDSAVMTGSAWKHFVITISGAHGSLPTGGGGAADGGPLVTIYINGQSQSLDYSNQVVGAYFPTSSANISNFRSWGCNTHKASNIF